MSTLLSPETVKSDPTAAFLRRRADAIDAAACDLLAQAAILTRYGLAEGAVRKNVRAADMQAYATLLRAQAQRVADMAADEREMRAEGCTAEDIAVYLRRVYGKAGK